MVLMLEGGEEMRENHHRIVFFYLSINNSRLWSKPRFRKWLTLAKAIYAGRTGKLHNAHKNTIKSKANNAELWEPKAQLS